MMKDETTRRDFLKAAGWAVVGVAGAAGLSYAQQDDKKKKKDDEKEPEEPESSENEEPNYDDLFNDDASSEEEETRACPQCGALMYRQGRTWTCENCGYSYVE